MTEPLMFSQFVALTISFLTYDILNICQYSKNMNVFGAHSLDCSKIFLVQRPLGIATLDIATALAIATSSPMELGPPSLHK